MAPSPADTDDNESNLQPTSHVAIRLLRGGGRFLLRVACIVAWMWSAAFAWCLDSTWPYGMAWALAGLIEIGMPIVYFRFRRSRPWIPTIALVAVVAVMIVIFYSMTPRHDRQWGVAQQKLPTAIFDTANPTDAQTVTINNIRSFRYGPVAPGNKSWYSDTYDLNKLTSVWFGVDRFTDVEPLAHTFLSFEFQPGTHRQNFLAFSVETRREQSESLYSPIRGIFNSYEVIYVIADEQDVLSVRSDIRENVVQLYPIGATQAQVKAIFLDMLDRVNAIDHRPEFYHTLTNNCTNNIVFHTNKVLEKPISAWQRGVVFPGYSDWLAYRLGMIDTELSLEDAREHFRIDQRVLRYDGRANFSEFIRRDPKQ